MKYRFATRLLIVFSLLVLVTSPAGIPPAQAAGPFSHNEVVRMALALLPASELSTLLNTYQGHVLAGSLFPDWGYAVDLIQQGDIYDYYAEVAHWPQFGTDYLNYIRRTYSPPYSDEAKWKIAFLFGILSHQAADPPFHNNFLPHAQAIDTTLLGGVPGHSDIELGVDVFNLFDRGCWDLDHIKGCYYKWSAVNWTLPTDAIMAAYADMYASGSMTEYPPDEGQLNSGWTTFAERSNALVTAATQGFTYYTVRLPNTHTAYEGYDPGGMTSMASLTRDRWVETWAILNYSGPYYVKPAGSGTGDCCSWDNACTLQEALSYGSSGREIRVATGIYTPATSGLPDPRTATFQLKPGVTLYGGFSGMGEAHTQRNLAANLTILSGDIDHNDSQTPVITDTTTVDGNTTNSYHVVRGSSGATLDGFIITAGYANGTAPDDSGAGMYNANVTSMTLRNIIFRGNVASTAGGGMVNVDSSLDLNQVTFSENTAAQAGGGMGNLSSSPFLTNVTFSGNTAGAGGGMSGWESSPTLNGVTFHGNEAAQSGGGMYNASHSNAQIHNSILWGNTAPTGAQTGNDNSSPVVSGSVVEGGYTGGSGIISADPLLGELGNYGGATLTIPLLPGSAAIHASSTHCPASDQRGVARGSTCDMGAFESQGFQLAIRGGNNQTALLNNPFTLPLDIHVTANDPLEPVDGGLITFTAPANGASASFTGGPATVVDGNASVTATANSSAGSYLVTASTQGGASQTFTLTNLKWPAILSLGNLVHTYDGQPKAASITASPSSLSVTVTYNGSPTPPVAAGTYAVMAVVDSTTYAGSATATMIINKALAVVSIYDLTQMYDGTPKIVTVVTLPEALAVRVTYDGSITPPREVGTYGVVVMVTAANYEGTATGTLTIIPGTGEHKLYLPVAIKHP